MIHKLADVQSKNIGKGTRVWQFCVILQEAVIGEDCNICANVLIENKVTIGDRVTIKSGVQIWDGVHIDDDVFVGPNVTFTNDLVPRSRVWQGFTETKIEKGASIGANSTIVAGNVVGAYSFIGAGSVVTRDIPANTIWYGNPATQKGYITNDAIMLDMNKKDKNGNYYEL